jgi:hypothetical protein
MKKKPLKIRFLNHGTNLGHRFTQECTTPPPPPPDSESHSSYEIFVTVKNHKSFSLRSWGAWRARHSERVSAHPKQTQWDAYFRDAPLQGHYPTSKCTRFYFLFFNFHYFPMIHTGIQGREMIIKKKGEHFEKWNTSSCKLKANLKDTFKNLLLEIHYEIFNTSLVFALWIMSLFCTLNWGLVS